MKLLSLASAASLDVARPPDAPFSSDLPTMCHNVQYSKLSDVKDSWQTTQDPDLRVDATTMATHLFTKIVRLHYAILNRRPLL